MNSEKRKKRYRENWLGGPDVLSSSCSQAECTGLVPAGDSLSEEEFRNYQDLFPFSAPKEQT